MIHSRQALQGAPRVICLDDEPLTRKALHRLLRRGHYDLHFAETPRQALELVQSRPVDLVITDQRMPEMSGVEFLRELEKAAPGTPGMILTAYPESVFVDDPPEAPRPPLFAKPWDDDTLLESIEGMIQDRRRRSAEQEARLRKEGPRTILVPLDGSIEAELALGSVLPLLEGEALRILLLRVVRDPGLHRDVDAYLRRTRERLASGGIEVFADVRWGDPAEQILLHARHARADLLVLPLPREGRMARLFGRSLAERILRETRIPLLVSRPDLALREFKRILILLDGSRDAEELLPEALRVARRRGATITVAGLEPRPGRSAVTERLVPRDPVPYLTEVVRFIGFEEVAAEPVVLVGDAAGELLRHAREYGSDLIFMTERGGDGWMSRLLGSPAGKILRDAPCPVYVRRSPADHGRES
jgi:nucleotide-binding universal stress UspA family protein/CheY-like chemotaxis protein